MENSCPYLQEIHELKSLLELQLKLNQELLHICRHTDLSAAFTVDAVNGLYALLDHEK